MAAGRAPLAGLGAACAKAEKAAQRAVRSAVRKIVAATNLGREQLGQAFFLTLWLLAGGQGEIDPYVVILRKGATADQDQRFVYV